ncbi:DUF2092 domain-containing protein [Chitinophagaceae bacterium 26-R-25]|nr:DUF2092 domain-containing protein [Chitinophagaceae bacterium 26-R-25]
MKSIFIGSFLALFFVNVHAQKKQQDTLAILIIDRMSDVIGDLESCSFKLNAGIDEWDPSYGLVKHFASYEVYLSGPSKMMVNVNGIHGHRQFLYNGNQQAYYSYDENNFGVIQTPGTSIEMIDSLHKLYDFDFPAGDFFYPAFTDDLLENTDSIRYLGIVKFDGKEYFHIVAVSKDINLQFWISNDAYNLPAKFSITYKNKEGTPQYVASFSDWQINPVLPNAMFDFLPPPNASQVRIMAKNEK